jgi:hypothetical protein
LLSAGLLGNANALYANGNPLKYIDPTGLAPGDPYDSAVDAGIQAAKDINERSIQEGREYAGRMYKRSDGKYSYGTSTWYKRLI